MKRICKDCGREFEISAGEEKFFRDKGLSLPKRCKDCRAKKSGSSRNTPETPAQSIPEPSGKRGKTPIIFALVLALIVAVFAAVTISSHYKSAERQLTSSTFISTTQAEAEQTSEATTAETTSEKSGPVYEYTFRNNAKWVEHFEKHGAETGCATKEEYLEKANSLIKNPDALTKTEAEDGDIVYYLPSTGEICFTTPGGTIRTYYIADYDYFNRQ